MINIRPLIETRLRALAPAFKEVAGAAGIANITQNRLADPGAYVFQEQLTAAPYNSSGIYVQQATIVVAVLVVVRNVRDARGTDAADVSYALQQSVHTALINWQADISLDPLEYVSGALVSFANGFHIWKDTFRTHLFIQ